MDGSSFDGNHHDHNQNVTFFLKISFDFCVQNGLKAITINLLKAIIQITIQMPKFDFTSIQNDDEMIAFSHPFTAFFHVFIPFHTSFCPFFA